MEQDRTMSEETKLSQVEGVKAVSNYLRGSIAEELRADTDHFNKDDSQLLKFHGTYQQDDREQRKSSDGGKSAKAYSYMIRTRIPGGRFDLRADFGSPRSVRRVRELDDEADDSASDPIAWDRQGRSLEDDPSDQRDRVEYVGRVR